MDSLTVDGRVRSLDLMTSGKSEIEISGDSITILDGHNFDTNQVSIVLIRELLANCFNIEFTLTMAKKIRFKELEDANDAFVKILDSFKLYCRRRKLKFYYVYEKHKSGHLHAHGIINIVHGAWNDYLLKTASIYKYFYRRGARFNWCRINDLHRPYKPTEGNLKRETALFSKWYYYLHKDVTVDNKVEHNFEEYYKIKPLIHQIPVYFRVLFADRTVDSSKLDEYYIADSSDDDSN